MAKASECILRISDANFRYRVSKPTLKNPFRKLPAAGIHEIEIPIYSGEIIGLVGPNGAGKSTLLRSLVGINKFDSVNASIEGLEESNPDILAQKLRKITGHMPEQVRWQGSKSIYAAINEIGMMIGVTEKKLKGVLDLVGLGSRESESLDSLSQGMRQRLSLACALLSSPKILVLDEPFNGLDPVASAAFKSLLSKLSNKGVSVIISSHQLETLDGVVDKLALMHKGKILAISEHAQLAKLLGVKRKLVIRGEGDAPNKKFLSKFGIDEEPIIEKTDWKLETTNTNKLDLKKFAEFYRINHWAVEKPTLTQLLVAATGLDPEEIGLQLVREGSDDLSKIFQEEEE